MGKGARSEGRRSRDELDRRKLRGMGQNDAGLYGLVLPAKEPCVIHEQVAREPCFARGRVDESDTDSGLDHDKTLLVVHADLDARDALAEMLEEHFEVLTAESGAEALLALEENPDIAGVLADLHLADMRPQALLERIRATRDQLPLVLLRPPLEPLREPLPRAARVTIFEGGGTENPGGRGSALLNHVWQVVGETERNRQ